MTVRLAWLEEVTICGFWRTRTLWVIHFGLCLSLIRNSYISSNIIFHFPFRIKAYFDIDIWRYLIFFSFLQNEWRKNWNWFWFWKVYFPILLKCLFVLFWFSNILVIRREKELFPRDTHLILSLSVSMLLPWLGLALRLISSKGWQKMYRENIGKQNAGLYQK